MLFVEIPSALEDQVAFLDGILASAVLFVLRKVTLINVAIRVVQNSMSLHLIVFESSDVVLVDRLKR